MDIHSNLKNIIHLQGFTVSGVAHRLKVAQPTVSRWCQNDHNGIATSPPNARYLVQLELLLNCRVSDMFPPIQKSIFPFITDSEKAR